MAGIGVRKHIIIVDVAPVKDANGFMKSSDEVLFSGWAEVTQPRGSRLYSLGQDAIEHTKFFKIRNHQAINSTVHTRLIYSGKRYTVNSIEKEKEKNFYWIIRATAQSNG